MPIPKRLFQTCKEAPEVPQKWQAYCQSWKTCHPHWEHVLTGDIENRQFIETHFPEYLHTYDHLPYPINRVDFVRYAQLDKHGGWYADCDMECIRSVDAFCQNDNQLVVASPMNRLEYMECACMGSIPNHPLWRKVMDEIRTIVSDPPLMHRFLKHFNHSLHVTSVTGPLLLGRVLKKCRKESWYSCITILPKESFYSKAWYDKYEHKNELSHPVQYPEGVYAIHHQHSTWMTDWNRKTGEFIAPFCRLSLFWRLLIGMGALLLLVVTIIVLYRWLRKRGHGCIGWLIFFALLAGYAWWTSS